MRARSQEKPRRRCHTRVRLDRIEEEADLSEKGASVPSFEKTKNKSNKDVSKD